MTNQRPLDLELLSEAEKHRIQDLARHNRRAEGKGGFASLLHIVHSRPALHQHER
jgi:hypothetical protein